VDGCFLTTGDAYVTRHVKAAGVFWTVWRPRSKDRAHRRSSGCSHRPPTRRAEFEAAVRAWLDFAAQHAVSADEIATGAAERAAVVAADASVGLRR